MTKAKLEIEAKKLENDKNYIGLIRIIEEQINKEDNPENKKFLKKKLKIAVKNSSQNMKTMTYEKSFEKKEIQKIINYFCKDKDINDILNKIWNSQLLYPSHKSVIDTANKTTPSIIMIRIYAII